MGAGGGHKITGSANGVLQALSSISLLELVEQDSRPTFILDLHDVRNTVHYQVQSVACNSSLRSFLNLQDGKPVPAHLEDYLGLHEPKKYEEYKEWAVGPLSNESSVVGDQSCFLFGGLLWNRSTLRKRWRIISGSATNCASSTTDLRITTRRSAEAFTLSAKMNHTGNGNDFDRNEISQSLERKESDLSWTNILPPNEHTELFKSTDWGATALGPLETWSPRLRQMTRLLMSDSRATSLFW